MLDFAALVIVRTLEDLLREWSQVGITQNRHGVHLWLRQINESFEAFRTSIPGADPIEDILITPALSVGDVIGIDDYRDKAMEGNVQRPLVFRQVFVLV